MRKFILGFVAALLLVAPAAAQQQIKAAVGIIGGKTYDSTAGNIAGGCIGLSGTFPKQTISGVNAVDARTTTSEALADSDRCKLVTFSNGSAIAVSIAQAGSGGNFAAGWKGTVLDLGAGTATITPATSTINGASTLVITTGQGCDIYSDGSNYKANCGVGSGGGLTLAGSSGDFQKNNGSGNLGAYTPTQATAALNVFVGDSGAGGTKGLVPAPGAGDAAAGKYLGAGGGYSVPPGGSATPGGSAGQLQYNNSGAFGGVTMAAHQVPVATGSGVVPTFKTVPDCVDSGGNHLNYTQSSDAFSCGTSSSGGGAGPTLTTATASDGDAHLQFTGLSGCKTITAHIMGADHQTDVPGDLTLQFGVGGTPTWDTAADYAGQLINNHAGTVTGDNVGQSWLPLIHDTNSGGTPGTKWASGTIHMTNLLSTSQWKSVTGGMTGQGDGGLISSNNPGFWNNTTDPVTAIRFQFVQSPDAGSPGSALLIHTLTVALWCWPGE